MRRRALNLVLLVVGFALGCLVTAQAEGGVFLPIVLKASTGASEPTPAPTPTVPGGPTVRAVNVHYYADKEKFFGEVVNETPYTVGLEELTLYLLDAGVPVGSERGYPLTSVLGPGESTPFRVSWYDSVPQWDSYLVHVAWDPTARLTVVSKELTHEEYPWDDWWTVTAEVRNDLSVRVNSFRVGAMLYGPSGEVVGYDYTYSALGPLQPGETLTTSITFITFFSYEWDTSIEPTDCGVLAVPYYGDTLLGEAVAE